MQDEAQFHARLILANAILGTAGITSSYAAAEKTAAFFRARVRPLLFMADHARFAFLLVISITYMIPAALVAGALTGIDWRQALGLSFLISIVLAAGVSTYYGYLRTLHRLPEWDSLD